MNLQAFALEISILMLFGIFDSFCLNFFFIHFYKLWNTVSYLFPVTHFKEEIALKIERPENTFEENPRNNLQYLQVLQYSPQINNSILRLLDSQNDFLHQMYYELLYWKLQGASFSFGTFQIHNITKSL